MNDGLGLSAATVSGRILGMPGVHHVTTAIAVRTLKYNAPIVRITDPVETGEI